MKCNRMLTSFVRKNLDNAHKVLVERILKKAERVEETVRTMGMTPITPGPGAGRPQPGSHMSRSTILDNPAIYNRPPVSPQMMSPQQDLGWQHKAMHPAFRPDENRLSTYSLPPYQANAQQQRTSYYQQAAPAKSFVAELPGSTYHTGHLQPPSQMNSPPLDHRMSMVSQLSGSDGGTLMGSPNLRGQSDQDSMVSERLTVDRMKAYEMGGNDRPESMVSGMSGHSSNPDRMSMISELPSDQHR